METPDTPSDVDETRERDRLVRALQRQMAARQVALEGGSVRIGWKLGMGDPEGIGSGPVVGYLTSASLLPSGGLYLADDETSLRAGAELLLEIGGDGEVAGYGAAVELVDVDERGGAEEIVAANVFHRAVAFGPILATWVDTEGALLVNGRVRGRERPRADHRELVGRTGELLAAVGEQLLPGDRLITGAIGQVPVRPGDRVTADLGVLGRAELRIARAPSAPVTGTPATSPVPG